MEPEMVAGMVFTLVVLAGVGGFILLLPLTRRLGAFLEWRMRERGASGGETPREVAQLRRQLEALSAQVAGLEERQAFTDSLLERRSREALPRSATE